MKSKKLNCRRFSSMWEYILSYVVILIMAGLLTGCFPHPVYQFWITGVKISPAPLKVNQGSIIELQYCDIQKPGNPAKTYHWKLEGHEEEFVTDRPFLIGVSWDTPGMKIGYVYTVVEDEEVLVNDFCFGILVHEETTQTQ